MFVDAPILLCRIDANSATSDTIDDFLTTFENRLRAFTSGPILYFFDARTRLPLKKNRVRSMVHSADVVLEAFRDRTVVTAPYEAEAHMAERAEDGTILCSDDSDLLHFCLDVPCAGIYRWRPQSSSMILVDPKQLNPYRHIPTDLYRLLMILLGNDFAPTVLSPARFTQVCGIIDERRLSFDIEAEFGRTIYEICMLYRHSPFTSKLLHRVDRAMLKDCENVIRLIRWSYEYSRDRRPGKCKGIRSLDDCPFPMIMFMPSMHTLYGSDAVSPPPKHIQPVVLWDTDYV